MISTLLQLTTIAASAVILTRSEPAINRMGRQTSFLVRMSMHFLTVGAVGEIGSILLFSTVPELATCIVLVGIAALLVCERRVRALTGPLGRVGNGPVTRSAK